MKANIYPGRGTLPDWNDLNIQNRERMPAHAYLIPFPDVLSCKHAVADNQRYVSPYVIHLNSGWECRYYPDILQLPESILSFRSGFEPAEVPGGLEPVDQPMDSDPGYPFPVMPPLVPAEQPVIVYRKTCRLPLLWGGLRKRLVLIGSSAACHVFVNGRLSGYTQGSCLPAEFDITNNLHEGDNELFILAYSRCEGSYLENQAIRPLVGLIRDIYFEAVPPISIYDLQTRTVPVPEDEGWRLDFSVQLISYRIALTSPQVKISLWKDEECLSETSWPVSLNSVDNLDFASPVQTVGLLNANLPISGIIPWQDENPQLYDLFISVEERGNRELVCVHQTIGFRCLTREDGEYLINGRPLQLRAVCWPENYLNGDSQKRIRQMIRSLRQIRLNNLNALYIRNYPADPILLELCDIYGIYVIDEAPLEVSHPLLLASLQNDPNWRAAAVERMNRLIRRDFNHPCVVMWSAGLFREKSAVVDMIARQARLLDDTRWLHVLDTPDLSADLDGWRTPQKDYADLSWLSYPSGLGRCFFSWGNQSDTLLNELKQMMRPLDISAIDATNGAFLVKNRQQWTTAGHFQVDWVLLRNGRLILSGELDNIRGEPGSEQYLEIWYGEQHFDDGADYVLRFEVSYAEPCLWADSGDEVFFTEFVLASAERNDLNRTSQSGGRLRLESDRHHLIISGSRFWLVFNRVNGTLESWRSGDKELIAASLSNGSIGISGLHASIERPPEYLDAPWLAIWREAGYDQLKHQVISTQEGCDGQSAVIEMMIRLAAPGKPALFDLITRYEIRASGDLRIYAGLTPLESDLPMLPGFGLKMNLKSDYSQINWYGTGLKYCFCHLHNSCRSGLFSNSQTDLGTKADLPSAKAGLFPDTRWLTLKDKTGFGLMVRSDQLFGFAARPAGMPDPLAGLTEGKIERKALGLQIFQQLAISCHASPVRASWYFSPIVSDLKE